MKLCFNYFLALMVCYTSYIYSNVTQVQTDGAPKAIGPYSQAVQAGQYLFVSGQLGVDPKTSKFVGDTVEEQTSQVLNNIEAILLAQGLTFQNVVKMEVYLKDMDDFKAMNTIYAKRLSHAIKPARQAMQVAKLPLDALVEISCIAFIPTISNENSKNR